MDSYPDNTALERAVRSMITTSSLFWVESDTECTDPTEDDLHGNNIGTACGNILKFIASGVLTVVPTYSLVSTIVNRMMDEMEKDHNLSVNLASRIAGFRAFFDNNAGYQFGSRLVRFEDVTDITNDLQITMHEPEDVENSSIADFYSIVREGTNVFRLEPLINKRILKKHGVAAVLASNYFSEDLKDDKMFLKHMIETDNITYFPCEKKYIPMVNERVRYLKENHTDLWNLFAERIYFDFYNHVYHVAMRADMEIDLLRECLDVFPNKEISSMIDFDNYHVGPKCGSLAILRLLRLTEEEFIFRLGLPRDTCVYTRDIIRRIAYEAVSDPHAHLVKIRQLTKARLMSTIADAEFVHGKCSLINDKDTMFEDVEAYGPNDVVRYVDDTGKIFQFTPREFLGIIRSQKNPYTNGQVLAPALYNMRGRLELEERDTVDGMMSEVIDPKDWDEMVHQTEGVRAINYVFMKLMNVDTWKEHISDEFDNMSDQLTWGVPGQDFRPVIFSRQSVDRYKFTPETRAMLLGEKLDAKVMNTPIHPKIEKAKEIYVKNTVDFMRNLTHAFGVNGNDGVYEQAESLIRPVIDNIMLEFMNKLSEAGVRIPEARESGHNVNPQKK